MLRVSSPGITPYSSIDVGTSIRLGISKDNFRSKSKNHTRYQTIVLNEESSKNLFPAAQLPKRKLPPKSARPIG